MNDFDKKLEEIVLKPAHWQLDDYIKAKKQLKTLFLATIKECVPSLNHVCGHSCNRNSDKWIEAHKANLSGWNGCQKLTLAKAEEVVGK